MPRWRRARGAVAGCFSVLVIAGVLPGATEPRSQPLPAAAPRGPRPPRRLALALAGGGSAAGAEGAFAEEPQQVHLHVRDAARGGAAVQMRFQVAHDDVGQVREVDADWVGQDLSAPVESAEDLLFLAASILGRDTRGSALWLAAAAGGDRRGSPAAGQRDAARPLRADSAAELWRRLVSAHAAKRALVVTDADASELVEPHRTPAHDEGARGAAQESLGAADDAPRTPGTQPAPQGDDRQQPDKPKDDATEPVSMAAVKVTLRHVESGRRERFVLRPVVSQAARGQDHGAAAAPLDEPRPGDAGGLHDGTAPERGGVLSK